MSVIAKGAHGNDWDDGRSTMLSGLCARAGFFVAVHAGIVVSILALL
jgi:hypothetical protein